MNPHTLRTVTRIVAEVLGHDRATLNPDERLVDLGADDLDRVDVCIGVLNEFDLDLIAVTESIGYDSTCTSIAEWLNTL